MGIKFKRIVGIDFPKDDVPELTVEQSDVWGMFYYPILIVAFGLMMNAAHMMGHFHCLHAPFSHMLLCGFVCSFVMYFAGEKYILNTFKEICMLWPMYIAILACVGFGLLPPFTLLPYILFRHICTKIAENRTGMLVDVLLVCFSFALQLTPQLTNFLMPIGMIAALSFHEMTKQGVATRSIGMTLFLTGALSWLSIFKPLAMHAYGVHVFFHDAILLLGVYRLGSAVRTWVKDQANILSNVLGAVTVFRNNQWQKLPLSKLKIGDYIYVKNGSRLPCNGLVTKCQGDAIYSAPSLESNKPFKLNETVLEVDSTLHANAIVCVESLIEHNVQVRRGGANNVFELFYTVLCIFIIAVALILSVRFPAMVLPVTSSLFLGACPCVFTISRPMIDKMFHYFATKADYYVQKMPAKWIKPTAVFFDRTNTIAFRNGSSDTFQIHDTAKKVIDWLHEQGCEVGILTKQSDQGRLAPMQEFLGEDVVIYPGQTDENKKEKILSSNKAKKVTMMFGDGENDVLAFDSAVHSLSHVKNTEVMRHANTACDLEKKDYFAYVKFLFATCDLMSQLEQMALWYNIAILALVGIYPMVTGAMLMQPSTCCMMMTFGSVVQVVRAYFGMIDNAKCHLEINDNNPIFEQFVEPAIVRFKKSQDDMVGVLRGLVENSQQRY